LNPQIVGIDTLTAAVFSMAINIVVAVVVWLIERRMARAERDKVEREKQAADERKTEQRKREDEHEELLCRLDALDDGMRSSLRNDLVGLHREWAEGRGSITLEAKEYAARTYMSYHRLGGNGTGTGLWQEIDRLPVKEERRA